MLSANWREAGYQSKRPSFYCKMGPTHFYTPKLEFLDYNPVMLWTENRALLFMSVQYMYMSLCILCMVKILVPTETYEG